MTIIKIPVLTDYILIVDDDVDCAQLMKHILDGDGEIDVVSDGKYALDMIQTKDYDLVVSDVDMPRMDGITFYLKATQKRPDLKGKFLFMTGDISPERQTFFQDHGINHYLKPFSVKDIRIAARKILLLKNTPQTSVP